MDNPLSFQLVFPILNLSLSFFFFILFLFSSYVSRRANLLLSLGMLVFFFHNIADILAASRSQASFDSIYFITAVLLWFWAPTVYLYLKSVYFKNVLIFKKSKLLHIIPGAVYAFLFLIVLFLSHHGSVDLIGNDALVLSFFGFPELPYWSLLYLQITVYFCLLAAAIYRFHFKVDRYRNAVPVVLNTLCILMLLVWGLFTLDYAYFLYAQDFLMPHYVSLILFTGLLAYIGVYRLMVARPIRSKKYKNSPLNESSSREIARQLAGLMEDKVYTDNDLTLAKLAAKLGYSPHQVSQVINQIHQVSFFDYINAYRVEEAKRLLASPKWQSTAVIDIGITSGFNSKSAFYNCFKKICDMTPNQYRNQQLSS